MNGSRFAKSSFSNLVRFHSTVRTRFAPSPTGFMHIGGLRMSLINYLYAKKNDGSFILRIEDTDQNRLVKGSVENILETLNLFGLKPDESPQINGCLGPYTQSQRLDIYRKHANILIDNHSAYYCFCKQSHNSGGTKQENHGCTCRNLSPQEAMDRVNAGERYTIRLRMPKENFTLHDQLRGNVTISSQNVDDTILMKSDGFPTYHLASIVDDHLMQISTVIRGEEWISSFPKHIQLYRAFGWEPPSFVHLPLLLNEKKGKISKREGGFEIQTLLSKGYLPSAILSYIYYLGLKRGNDAAKEKNGHFLTIQEMIEDFDIAKLSASPVCINSKLLDHFNQLQITAALTKNKDEFISNLKQFVTGQNVLSVPNNFNWTAFLDYSNSRIVTLQDAIPYLRQILSPEKIDLNSISACVMVKGFDDAKTYFSEMQEGLRTCNFNHKDISTLIMSVGEKHVEHRKKMMALLRWGLTSSKNGLGMSEVIELIGRDETIRRLQVILEWL